MSPRKYRLLLTLLLCLVLARLGDGQLVPEVRITTDYCQCQDEALCGGSDLRRSCLPDLTLDIGGVEFACADDTVPCVWNNAPISSAQQVRIFQRNANGRTQIGQVRCSLELQECIANEEPETIVFVANAVLDPDRATTQPVTPTTPRPIATTTTRAATTTRTFSTTTTRNFGTTQPFPVATTTRSATTGPSSPVGGTTPPPRDPSGAPVMSAPAPAPTQANSLTTSGAVNSQSKPLESREIAIYAGAGGIALLFACCISVTFFLMSRRRQRQKERLDAVVEHNRLCDERLASMNGEPFRSSFNAGENAIRQFVAVKDVGGSHENTLSRSEVEVVRSPKRAAAKAAQMAAAKAAAPAAPPIPKNKSIIGAIRKTLTTHNRQYSSHENREPSPSVSAGVPPPAPPPPPPAAARPQNSMSRSRGGSYQSNPEDRGGRRVMPKTTSDPPSRRGSMYNPEERGRRVMPKNSDSPSHGSQYNPEERGRRVMPHKSSDSSPRGPHSNPEEREMRGERRVMIKSGRHPRVGL